MKASLLYKISSVLLILFAIGHTLGFRKIDPRWGVDGMVNSMRSIHFLAQGMDRTYWDFYVGFGLFVTILMLFAALMAWQFGRLPEDILKQMKVGTWAFALCFAGVTYLSWRYFFPIPIVFSALATVLLTAAAWKAN